MLAVDAPTRSRLLRTLPILQAMQRVHGHLYDDEADLLIGAAADALTRIQASQSVVEIGSFHGKSTVGLGLVAKTLRPDAKVYAIDPHEGELTEGDHIVNVEPTFAAFMANITNAGLRNIVVPIKERSTDVNWSKPIGLLFIDGLHDYYSVAHDFAHFAPSVVPGGYIAFHDYGKPDFPGVTAFVDETIDLGYCRPVQRAAGLIVLERPEQRVNTQGSPRSVPRFLSTQPTRPNWKSRGWRAMRTGTVAQSDVERADARNHFRTDRLRALVDDYVEPGATVLTVGLEGDRLAGRSVWRFPHGEDPTVRASAPSDDGALIAALEARRAEGADYLLVAGTAVTWLEDHPALRRHLDDAHLRVAGPDDAEGSIIYELFPANAGAAGEPREYIGRRALGIASILLAAVAASKLWRRIGARMRAKG